MMQPITITELSKDPANRVARVTVSQKVPFHHVRQMTRHTLASQPSLFPLRIAYGALQTSQDVLSCLKLIHLRRHNSCTPARQLHTAYKGPCSVPKQIRQSYPALGWRCSVEVVLGDSVDGASSIPTSRSRFLSSWLFGTKSLGIYKGRSMGDEACCSSLSDGVSGTGSPSPTPDGCVSNLPIPTAAAMSSSSCIVSVSPRQ
mmetsp:Transcript_13/g.25  ORF Transcript_13/g.25 Transcript_13/m.25 type:complete len:202 (+) Transcript_13:534-1139(+)